MLDVNSGTSVVVGEERGQPDDPQRAEHRAHGDAMPPITTSATSASESPTRK